MSYIIRGTNPDAPHLLLPDWFGPLFNGWLTMQTLPWQVLLDWQAAASTVQQEMWDQWTVRWAGGAPID